MKVVWAGTFQPNFGRNRQLSAYLKAAGLEVDVLRVSVWPEDRIEAFRSRSISMLFRLLLAELAVMAKLAVAPRPDAYLVSYPGWFDVPGVWLIGRIRGVPLVFDPFISLYETAVEDRGLVPRSSLTARMTRTIDRIALRRPALVVADTATHADYFRWLSGSNKEFLVAEVGANEGVFNAAGSETETNLVLFYGTFVPLHGVDVIVRAANLLDPSVRFVLYGDGQTRAAAETLNAGLLNENVEFRDPVTHEHLASAMASATIVLGVFSESAKADRVIPHKVFEAMASGRPVVTARTTATEGLEAAGAVMTCRPGDPEDLAASIQRLLNEPDLREKLAIRSAAVFAARFSVEAQSSKIRRAFLGLTEGRRKRTRVRRSHRLH